MKADKLQAMLEAAGADVAACSRVALKAIEEVRRWEGPARTIPTLAGLILVPVDSVWRCQGCGHDEYNHGLDKRGKHFCAAQLGDPGRICQCPGFELGGELE